MSNEVAAHRDTIPLGEGLDQCKEMLVNAGHLLSTSIATYFSDWDNFKAFADGDANSLSQVKRELLVEFLNARDSTGSLPAVATMDRRRSSVRRLFWCARALRLVVRELDPAADLPLPPRSYAQVRPLFDDEVVECRSAATGFANATRYRAIWALAEAGCTGSEMCAVVRSAVDAEGGWLVITGGGRNADRLVTLTAWAAESLAEHLATLPSSPNVPVVYNGPGCSGRRPTLSGPINKIFQWAGLGCERDVNAESIRAWVGVQVFGLSRSHAEVARVLGLDSLDKAASLIGDRWWE